MSSVMFRGVTALFAGLITYGCVSVYAEMTGISPNAAVFGAAIAVVWCLMIYPSMGRNVLRDVYMTLLIYPVVGVTAGTFFIPINGTIMGLQAALLLPFKAFWPVAPLYLLGGAIVFFAPRIARRFADVKMVAAE